jgi:hypothetical protein
MKNQQAKIISSLIAEMADVISFIEPESTEEHEALCELLERAKNAVVFLSGEKTLTGDSCAL